MRHGLRHPVRSGSGITPGGLVVSPVDKGTGILTIGRGHGRRRNRGVPVGASLGLWGVLCRRRVGISIARLVLVLGGSGLSLGRIRGRSVVGSRTSWELLASIARVRGSAGRGCKVNVHGARSVVGLVFLFPQLRLPGGIGILSTGLPGA
jgi:hypothetical protein